MRALRKRDVASCPARLRFAWTRTAPTPKDLEYFVKDRRHEHDEALLSPPLGGPMMKRQGDRLRSARAARATSAASTATRRRHHDPAGQGAHPVGDEGGEFHHAPRRRCARQRTLAA
jgi:hypothetical protein